MHPADDQTIRFNYRNTARAMFCLSSGADLKYQTELRLCGRQPDCSGIPLSSDLINRAICRRLMLCGQRERAPALSRQEWGFALMLMFNWKLAWVNAS